jgi:hypothetical protein
MNAKVRAMNATPRCGAKTRAGSPCKSPAVGHQGRCRMHRGGGAKGAPEGNTYGMKHGLCSKRVIALRRQLRELVEAIKPAGAAPEPSRVRREAVKPAAPAKAAVAAGAKADAPRARLNRHQRRALKARKGSG